MYRYQDYVLVTFEDCTNISIFSKVNFNRGDHSQTLDGEPDAKMGALKSFDPCKR